MQRNAELEALYNELYNKLDEEGRSMIEMLGVLAIVGVLSVGGLAGYTMAMERFKATKSIDQVQKLVTNIKTLYESQRNYSGIDVTVLTSAGVMTDDMLNAAGNAGLNVYDGTIGIGEGTSSSTFVVSYEGLPKSACSKMATVNWGSSGSGLISMTITAGTGGSGGTKTYTWDGANPLPVSLTNALGSCDGTTGNIIAWEFN